MGRLDGKVAMITGASRGMGAEHAKEFVQEGAKVAITDILEDEGRQLADEIGENATFVKLDITKLEDWENAIQKTKEAFGDVNILVNNAGYPGPFDHVADLDVDEYLKVINIDQHGTFYGMKAVIPHMLSSGGGTIVNIASVAGEQHVEGTPSAAYTAAKHAVMGLTKAAAVEYAAKNIRINAILPGSVLTPMMRDVFTQEQIDAAGSMSPINRLANPREISKVVAFLASDDSSYVTGAGYAVDGGLMVQ